MRTVNIHEAKTTLSQLIALAESGEGVIIARAGRPVARLVPIEANRKGIRLGTLKGTFKRVSRDFDAPLPAATLSSFLDALIEP